ncbi:uncharacterized protein DSM5745_08646 [Aspergillus mulundensis]|uniref:Uncharacterized protein n=1 Tax=Aspergillus mulundensis TaxID=1810919 RepID=A0A3D8R4I3_9EURO|nr:hypothetical protein DSM5745_08646 [Aspergillus mulundensis]RDW68886.1 hypothetical protein DSM5745_08646 [Aspergillus mulundensis]
MNFIASFFSAVALASLAAAVPQTDPAPQVTIYDSVNYEGESLSFSPDDSRQTLFPWIESVLIPEGEDIYCQLFNNTEFTCGGGQVIISSLPDVDDEDEVYPGIVCGILS